MILINEHFLDVEPSYLFSDIASRVDKAAAAKPQQELIRLGIGDVTRPLPEAVARAMSDAALEMGTTEGFHGYGPEQGYPWLRELIARHDYQARGVEVDPGEIFVSDGAKCDTGNILDILGSDLTVAVQDPVYPVYVDTNIMAGRKDRLVRMPATAENGFRPLPDETLPRLDLIYLCSPNNPTGQTADREMLDAWVDYARQHHSLILFDAAYEAFITDDSPRSIYEIPGARDCAIELRSYSKNAGFTGVRCGFVVVPEGLKGWTRDGRAIELRPLWSRRQTTKFNGVSYIVQRGAAATYSEAGQAGCEANIRAYMDNVRTLRDGLETIGFRCWGGENAPYVWVAVPDGYTSWSFFDELLDDYGLVTTPGSGFGQAGEGYIRLSAFGSAADTRSALQRLKSFAG